MASHIDTLKSTLGSVGKYTPLTDAEIQAAAAQRVGSIYAAREQNAQNVQQSGDAAYARQLEDMLARYGAAEARSGEQYAAATERIAEQTRSRGMQRGSYINALTAYMGRLGEEAAGQISQAKATKAGEAAEDRQRLEQQLAEQMAQFGVVRKTDTAAYADTLGAREYDRGVTADKTAGGLAETLYKYEHQLEQEAEDRRQWEDEMAYKREKTMAQNSGGGRGGSSKQNTKEPAKSGFDDFLSKMSGVADVGTAWKKYQFQRNPTLPKVASKYLSTKK